MGFFSKLFGFDKAKAKAVVEQVVAEAVDSGKDLAEAEVNKALDKLAQECDGIGHPERRDAALRAVAAVRVAFAGLMEAIRNG